MIMALSLAFDGNESTNFKTKQMNILRQIEKDNLENQFNNILNVIDKGIINADKLEAAANGDIIEEAYQEGVADALKELKAMLINHKLDSEHAKKTIKVNN